MNTRFPRPYHDPVWPVNFELHNTSLTEVRGSPNFVAQMLNTLTTLDKVAVPLVYLQMSLRINFLNAITKLSITVTTYFPALSTASQPMYRSSNQKVVQ